jgi:hypothetical protein
MMTFQWRNLFQNQVLCIGIHLETFSIVQDGCHGFCVYVQCGTQDFHKGIVMDIQFGLAIVPGFLR